MARLFDRFGRWLRSGNKSDLLEEHSGAEVGTVRQVETSHPAVGLEPGKLAAILNSSETGDATAYLDLAEQMEEKDLHYAAVLGVRKRAIRGLELVVDPKDDSDAAGEAADMVREALTGPEIRESLIDVLDSIGKGYSVSEIIWDMSGPRYEIAALEYRPPRWFEFDSQNGYHLRRRGDPADARLPTNKYVIHLARAKSGFPIRGGLARLAAWAFMFKNFTVKDWAIFLEAYGHPLRLGKYEASVASDPDKRTLLKAARSIGVDMAAIIPKNMDLEVIATNTSTTDSYERKARWWDEQISKGVLGQVATTDAIAGGHAVGKIHEDVRDDIRDADADQLAITLMRDVAAPLTGLNLGESVPVPTLRYRTPESVDPEKLLRLMETAGPAGLKIAVADVYRAFSLQPPADDEELLAFKQPEAPAARQLAARDHGEHTDQITNLIDELVANGGMQRVADHKVGQLIRQLSGAGSFEDALKAIEQHRSKAPDANFREQLARAMFAARLSGELDNG